MDFAKSKPRRRKLNKQSTLTKILTVVIGLIIVSIVFVAVYFNARTNGRINILLVNDAITLISLEVEKKTLTVVPIPQELYLTVSSGKGQIKSSTLFKFDSLQKKKGILLNSTIREFFGIPIDGWVKIPSTYKIESLNDFVNFKNKELTLFDLKDLASELAGFKTNLFPLALKRFYFQLGTIREDKVEFLDLNNSQIFQKEILPDGSEVLVTDPVSLDSLLREKFYEWKIVTDNLSISVLNGTNSSGLATKAARVVANIGGKVVMVGESQEKTVDCLISASKDKHRSYTVKRLQKTFSCEVKDEKIEGSRADVTLIVGNAYEKEVVGR